jgi:16S rRNA (uracil1498-N3)-methyltransferase
MEYYFTPPKKIKDNKLTIEGDDFRHLSKVLRKKRGDPVWITDGERNLYKTEIEIIDRDSIKCRITEKLYNINEPEIKVTLYQSLIKNPARFEFAVEKSVELGVYEINPMITEHVISRRSDRTERWQSIALAAMKQSQRCYLPEVKHPVNFTEAVSLPGKDDLKIIADERIFPSTVNADKLNAIIGKNQNISVFIGPEGGFTNEEIETAVNAGFVTANLGLRKYRSETAAIAMLSIILTKR